MIINLNSFNDIDNISLLEQLYLNCLTNEEQKAIHHQYDMEIDLDFWIDAVKLKLEEKYPDEKTMFIIPINVFLSLQEIYAHKFKDRLADTVILSKKGNKKDMKNFSIRCFVNDQLEDSQVRKEYLSRALDVLEGILADSPFEVEVSSISELNSKLALVSKGTQIVLKSDEFLIPK